MSGTRTYINRPITIAVYFWRGIAVQEEDAKDTVVPRVHGSYIGGVNGILEDASSTGLTERPRRPDH